MSPAAHKPASVYERTIEASLERIWENVQDWEHLPFLHSQAFSSIDLLDQTEQGWSAWVGVAGSDGRALVEVRIDRRALEYVTKTTEGVGAGTEIVTVLTPVSPASTAIRVEFFLDWAPVAVRPAFGEAYRSLYATLWDQDEAMMRERQRVLDHSRRTGDSLMESLVVGTVSDLDRTGGVAVDFGGRPVGVVVIDGEPLAFDARCPHLGGPLDPCRIQGRQAECPWHGYRYDVSTGRSCDGRGLRLFSAPAVEVEGFERSVRLVRR